MIKEEMGKWVEEKGKSQEGGGKRKRTEGSWRRTLARGWTRMAGRKRKVGRGKRKGDIERGRYI